MSRLSEYTKSDKYAIGSVRSTVQPVPPSESNKMERIDWREAGRSPVASRSPIRGDLARVPSPLRKNVDRTGEIASKRLY